MTSIDEQDLEEEGQPSASFEACPLDICDGSGIIYEGEFDDIRERECPHVKDSGDVADDYA